MAFVNLSADAASATPDNNGFDLDPGHRNTFGIHPDHNYNVINVAAIDPARRKTCLWNQNRSGSSLLRDGITVTMNRVPANESGWASAPYEPQYLKLIDVSATHECTH